MCLSLYLLFPFLAYVASYSPLKGQTLSTGISTQILARGHMKRCIALRISLVQISSGRCKLLDNESAWPFNTVGGIDSLVGYW